VPSVSPLVRAQGHGHGRGLIDRQLEGLRREGARGVHLDVAAPNANALAFYRHLGFTDVERRGSSIFMGIRLA
jgi:ribosomal protein S18 acetylase RimI-like enzyme